MHLIKCALACKSLHYSQVVMSQSSLVSPSPRLTFWWQYSFTVLQTPSPNPEAHGDVHFQITATEVGRALCAMAAKRSSTPSWWNGWNEGGIWENWVDGQAQGTLKMGRLGTQCEQRAHDAISSNASWHAPFITLHLHLLKSFKGPRSIDSRGDHWGVTS